MNRFHKAAIIAASILMATALLIGAGCSALTPEQKRKIGAEAIRVGMTVAEMILAAGEPEMVVPIRHRAPMDDWRIARRRWQYGDTVAVTEDGEVVDVFSIEEEMEKDVEP